MWGRACRLGHAVSVLTGLQRAIPSTLQKIFMRQPPNIVIAGIPTLRATRAELATIMVADYRNTQQGHKTLPRIVISSNGSVIAAFHGDPSFRSLVMEADMIDADGMPLVMASRIFCHNPLLERVATTDFIHNAADAAVSANMRFYFLGGETGIAERAAQKLVALHPGLDIVGCRDGFFKPEDEAAICADIVKRGTDVLWLGLGSPKQEAFAVRNRSALTGLTWIRTCGGLFDHVVGRTRRAPQWMQSCGIEWLFRAAQEPRRLGPRYLRTNPVAAFHLFTKTHD
jgi:N-acetylglucosaminyldiphosphoundecaprenol N-acetyl-beta-D-mannosaminyltransferase